MIIFICHSEKRRQRTAKNSILANAYEALLGAIYLDQGLDVVREFFLKHYDHFSYLIDTGDFFDHKTQLQEFCQKVKAELPNYRIVREEGPDHQKVFHIEAAVEIDDVYFISQGDATNKKKAEQEAAQHILDMMSYYRNRFIDIALSVKKL